MYISRQHRILSTKAEKRHDMQNTLTMCKQKKTVSPLPCIPPPSSMAALASLVRAGVPAVPAGMLQWKDLMWGCSSCLLPPPLPTRQFTPDQQWLHFTQEFSIFYFLSPSMALPVPFPHHTTATNSKTSCALEISGWRQWHPRQPVTQQHAWYFRPASMTQYLPFNDETLWNY